MRMNQWNNEGKFIIKILIMAYVPSKIYIYEREKKKTVQIIINGL